MRPALAALIALGLLMSAPRLHADELPTPRAAVGTDYSTAGKLPGTRVESVLTDPKGAVTSTKPGTGWLLHAGPRVHDMCEEEDATSGLRLMCVGW
jgi:hypothetical protein